MLSFILGHCPWPGRGKPHWGENSPWFPRGMLPGSRPGTWLCLQPGISFSAGSCRAEDVRGGGCKPGRPPALGLVGCLIKQPQLLLLDPNSVLGAGTSGACQVSVGISYFLFLFLFKINSCGVAFQIYGASGFSFPSTSPTCK